MSAVSTVASLPGEEWRPVVSFGGIFALLYKVSNYGRVRSIALPPDAPRRRGRPHAGRILRPQLTQRGYLRAKLCAETIQQKVFVHRLVLEAFVELCPPEMQACHGDGNRQNNVLSNLRWATSKDNHADRWSHGTMAPTLAALAAGRARRWGRTAVNA
jgi:hypothetical protein